MTYLSFFFHGVLCDIDYIYVSFLLFSLIPRSIAIDYGHLHAHDRDDDLDVPGASPASSSSTLSTFTPASSPTAATTVLLATYDAPATTATHAETLAVTAHPAAHHALSVPPVSLPVTVTNAEALRSVDVMRVGDGAVCPGAWAVGGPDQVPSGKLLLLDYMIAYRVSVCNVSSRLIILRVFPRRPAVAHTMAPRSTGG